MAAWSDTVAAVGGGTRSGPGLAGFCAVAIVMLFRVVRLLRRRGRGQTSGPRPGPPVVPKHPVVMPPPGPAGPGAVGRVDALESVRELMGPAPRTFDRSLHDYLHVDPPPWLKPDGGDEMYPVFPAQDRLRRDGRVVWAAVVQANQLIFRPGPMDHGASVIWSADPYFDARPRALLPITENLFALKGTDQADAEAAAFARMLTNELTRAHRLAVPTRFTNGRAVYHSSLMLSRKHLPKGRLTGRFMPVWADPTPTGLVLLVPAAYWPASLTAQWNAE